MSAATQEVSSAIQEGYEAREENSDEIFQIYEESRNNVPENGKIG